MTDQPTGPERRNDDACPPEAAYGPIERDLCRLAADRTQEAIHSVMQLTDSPEVQFFIASHVMAQAIGCCAGKFKALHPDCDATPMELATSILGEMRDAADEARQ